MIEPGGARGAVEGWSTPARALHWLVALAVLVLLALGLTMVNAPLGAGQKFDLYQWHKSLGVLVLPLLLLRSAHRLATGRPPPIPATRLAGAAAVLVHALLHVVPLAMVATGYLLASASVIPIPITLPLGITVPLAGSPDLAREDLLKSVHHLLGYGLAIVVAIHVAAALWHAFVLRDGVLQRMAPVIRPRPPAAA